MCFETVAIIVFFMFYILQHFLHLLLFKLQNYGQNTAPAFSYHGHVLISAVLLLLQSVFFCVQISGVYLYRFYLHLDRTSHPV